MTTRKKKTTIITETDRLLIFNRHSGAVEGWCDDCADLAGIVRPAEAAALAGFRLGAVYRQLELKKLYPIATGPDEFDACIDSLLKPA